MSKIVTQAQIAARAGVSQAAVSCALRGQSNIPKATREQVQRAARELGYQPNPLLSAHMAHLRALRKPRYRATLAYIIHTVDSWGENELIARYWHGCCSHAAELGYSIDRFRLGRDDMTGAQLSRILATRKIHGVIIGPLMPPLSRVEFDWGSFASASLGFSLCDPSLHRACHDNFNTVGEVMQRLAAAGYRKVGLAMPECDDMRVNHNWLGGYLAHRHYLKRMKHVPPLVVPNWNEQVFRQWFEQHQPDAVVSTTSALLRWVQRAGCRVPADVGFASLFWTKAYPDCSACDQNCEQIGAAAVDLVIQQLNRNERGVPVEPRVVLVKGKWVQGGTLRSTENSKPLQT